MRCGNRFDCVFVQNPSVCNRCYKRLLRLEKAKPNLRSLQVLQEEIKEDFKKGGNRTKRLSRNSPMMVNKIDRPNTTPTVRAIGTFAVYFSVFRPFCRFTLVYKGHFVI